LRTPVRIALIVVCVLLFWYLVVTLARGVGSP
jgi:hypothetical protein